MRVSFVIPCRNEAETVGEVVREVSTALKASNLDGEIIVVDNLSTDNSAALARGAGAHVVFCAVRGYGAALQLGIEFATGDIIVTADADGAHDVSEFPRLLQPITAGADVVIGNRLTPSTEPGVIPWLHRYVGIPLLTGLMNLVYGTRISDAHCGLRCFTREAYNQIMPRCPGMEFASELIVRAAQRGLRIDEVATSQRRTVDARQSHLRTWRDGFRHLRFLVTAWRHCPRGASRRDECKASQRKQSVRRRARVNGITQVELLVVISIIAALVSLAIPAIQGAREAARRSACENQLRQLVVGALLHQSAHGHFPTGGWDWSWCGDPNRGYGAGQPGGWFYNVLPFIEQQAVHDLGAGLTGEELRKANARRIRTLVDGVLCPSRRQSRLFDHAGPPLAGQIVNAAPYSLSTRIDYAANTGTVTDLECILDNQEFDDQSSDQEIKFRRCANLGRFSGISFQTSLIRPAHVSDGLAHTYILGEKYLNASEYESGIDPGDNESPYSGVNVDHFRSTHAQYKLFPDEQNRENRYAFGSAHRSGFYMARCDGSVEYIPFDIDSLVHASLGNRHDGQ